MFNTIAQGKAVGLIVSLVIGLALVIFVLMWARGAFIKAQPGQYISELEDCDRDRVPNFRDKCKCTSTGGVEAESLPGCPKGTTPQQAEKDSAECEHLAPKDKPSTFTPECPEKDKEKCITKCDYVHNTIPALPEEAGKGLAGNWDVTVGSYKLYRNNQEMVVTNERVDILLSEETFLDLEIEPAINNAGAEAASIDFSVGVYVCSDKNKEECTPAILASGERGDKAWSVKGLGSGETRQLPKQTFHIGKSDFCSGKAGKCFIKIMADTTKNLAEKEEFNNGKYFYLSIEGKQKAETPFSKFKSIELVINDEGDADPESKPIEQMCLDFIGDGDVFKCSSKDNSCGKGEFPYTQQDGDAVAWDNLKGCLLVVSEEDTASNNCGYAGAENGVTLDYLAHEKLEPLRFPFRNTDGDDANNALAYQWKSLPQGSLLCNLGEWYLCDESTDFQRVFIGNADFLCKDKHWVKA